VQQLVWRNYNLPPDVVPAYSGTCSVKTRVAVRATSAAPTFFTPVVWNNITVIDGAFTANNPSFTAVNEAMVRYHAVDDDNDDETCDDNDSCDDNDDVNDDDSDDNNRGDDNDIDDDDVVE